MPEGHTLFALARDLDAAFAGTAPDVTSPQGRFASGAAMISGEVVRQATSRGKHLFVEFDHDLTLWVHLGLIGTFTIDAVPYAGELPVVGQVRCRLANDAHVADLRGPMTCEVVTDDKVASVLGKLGPDPLRAGANGSDLGGSDPGGSDHAGSDPDRAWAKITRSRKPIAELLMDQAVLAGAGNVYRCEVLFRQRTNPMRPGNLLKRHTWNAIWDDLVTLMPLGVATSKIVTTHEQVEQVSRLLDAGQEVRLRGRESYVYKRTGEPCAVCGSRVRSAPLAGRTLYWCGRCQRRG